MAGRPSSSASARFVDAALCTTGPLALSYVHHGLRRNVRDDLLSLLAEFPSLRPFSDTFVHDDGTAVRLLCARGALPLPLAPPLPPAVELTVWLHQSHPFVPPIVYPAVGRGHRFVDASSGAAATPYLRTWQYPNSNLLDMARNLVKVFTLCPPSSALTGPAAPPPPHAGGSLASGREATDRLYASLSTELADFLAQAEEDVFSLLHIQSALRDRARAVDGALKELRREKESLTRLVRGVEQQADVLRCWLLANGSAPPAGKTPDPEEVFDLDEDSRHLLGSTATHLAVDDLTSALDEALNAGALPFDAYLKQVRALSREQFLHIAAAEKIERRSSGDGESTPS